MINIKLDISNKVLSGQHGAKDDILVELDGSKGAFDVELPDLRSCGSRVFMFKNLGASSVTLKTVHGQIIDYSEVTSKIVVYKEFYSLASNGIDKWISLKTQVYPLNIACTDLASSIALLNQVRLDHVS